MGKAKNKAEGPGGAGEEARPSGGPGDSAPFKEEGNAGDAEGSAPTPTPAPAPVPRKRGRPRKVVAPKVEENTETRTQEALAAETKKQKAESLPGRNGSATDVHQSTTKKSPVQLPLRREGSRRKSEPRRAAD